MSRKSLAVRGLMPVAIAVCAVAMTSTAAWAAPPPPRPAPPAPPHQAPRPAPINNDLCIRDHGRVVIDPHNPRLRHCEGGPHNGVELK
jgi:hypothetical protein